MCFQLLTKSLTLVDPDGHHVLYCIMCHFRSQPVNLKIDLYCLMSMAKKGQGQFGNITFIGEGKPSA